MDKDQELPEALRPIIIEREVVPEVMIKTQREMDAFLLKHNDKLVVAIFTQNWNESKVTIYDNILKELENEALAETHFCRVVAEDAPELCEAYRVSLVPTIVLIRFNKIVDSILGTRMRDVVGKITTHAAKKTPGAYPDPDKVAEAAYVKKHDIDTRIDQLINKSKVMVFIKGTPAEPKCGFSRAIVALLDETGIPYSSFDILTDEEVRQTLKVTANWQTYPQLYVNGQLIGGLDIVKELKHSGDLISTLNGS